MNGLFLLLFGFLYMCVLNEQGTLLSDFDDKFTHGLVAFHSTMSGNDVFPIELPVNEQFV